MFQQPPADYRRSRRPSVIVGIALLGVLPIAALADPSDICVTSARQASAQTGVPLSVLLAITQTETGRRVDGTTRPWPWTINMEGAGHWFPNRAEALDFAMEGADAGRVSFDVGCFQINYRWHGANFDSIAAMFDPEENALYAARFLAGLYSEKGDWSAAAGAYHSRTEEFAARYRTTFDRYYAQAVAAGADRDGPVLASADAGTGAAPLPRVNTFPLLQQRPALGGLGSLVPLGAGG